MAPPRRGPQLATTPAGGPQHAHEEHSDPKIIDATHTAKKPNPDSRQSHGPRLRAGTVFRGARRAAPQEPLRRFRQAMAQPVVLTPTMMTLSHGKLLLIEDEDDLRAILEEYLRDSGLAVASFSSAERAVPYWQQHSGEIDLILTDMRMPGRLDGVEFARYVRKNTPEGARKPQIMMISGFDPPPRSLLAQLGITEFISKPFRISELSRLCQAKMGG